MQKNTTPEVCPSLSDEQWNEYIKIADEEVGSKIRGGVPRYLERSDLTSLANFTIVQNVASGVTDSALMRVAIQHRILDLLRNERTWRKPLVPLPEDDGGDDDEWD